MRERKILGMILGRRQGLPFARKVKGIKKVFMNSGKSQGHNSN